MKAIDVTADLRALSNPKKPRDAARNPWYNGELAYDRQDRESMYPQPEYVNDTTPDESPSYANSDNEQVEPNSSFRQPYADSSRQELQRVAEEDRESSLKKARVEENPEYTRMKLKYLKSIAQQKNRIDQTVGRNRKDSNIDHDREARRQALLSNIHKLNYGTKARPARNRGDSASLVDVRVNGPIPEESENINSSRMYRPQAARQANKLPGPEYKFDTKNLAEQAKLSEYTVRRKFLKKNDFLKDYFKECKENGRVAKPKSYSQAYEAERYAIKTYNNKGINSEAKRMVVERIREIDRQADQTAALRRMTDRVADNRTSEEEPYLESIHMKMNLLSKIM